MPYVLRALTLLLEICTQRGGCVRAACVEGERLIKEGRSKQKMDDLMLVDWGYWGDLRGCPWGVQGVSVHMSGSRQ